MQARGCGGWCGAGSGAGSTWCGEKAAGWGGAGYEADTAQRAARTAVIARTPDPQALIQKNGMRPIGGVPGGHKSNPVGLEAKKL